MEKKPEKKKRATPARVFVPVVHRKKILHMYSVLPPIYFPPINKLKLKEFQGISTRHSSWVLHLQKLLPDQCCLIYDQQNYDAPFEYLNGLGTTLAHYNLQDINKQKPNPYARTHLGKQKAPKGQEYVPDKIRDTHHDIYMASWVPTMFANCLKQTHRYIVLSLRIQAISENHINPLIYDKKTKTLYRFEMHGAEATKKAIHYHIDAGISKTIQNNVYLKTVIKIYKGPSAFCPPLGPQAKENLYQRTHLRKNPHGYCLAWSLLFIHALLHNPTIDIPTMAKIISRDEGKDLYDLICRYTTYIMLLEKETDIHFFKARAQAEEAKYKCPADSDDDDADSKDSKKDAPNEDSEEDADSEYADSEYADSQDPEEDADSEDEEEDQAIKGKKRQWSESSEEQEKRKRQWSTSSEVEEEEEKKFPPQTADELWEAAFPNRTTAHK